MCGLSFMRIKLASNTGLVYVPSFETIHLFFIPLFQNRMSELVSVEPRRNKFMEQANALLQRIPEASAEVGIFLFNFTIIYHNNMTDEMMLIIPSVPNPEIRIIFVWYIILLLSFYI